MSVSEQTLDFMGDVTWFYTTWPMIQKRAERIKNEIDLLEKSRAESKKQKKKD